MPDRPWTLAFEQAADELAVDVRQGLSQEQVRRRREQFGPNQLRAHQPRSTWAILWEQFKSIVVLLLVGALILAVAFAQWPEAIAVAAVILLNTAMGFTAEWRAVRSMEALRQLGKEHATVLRGGQKQGIEAAELVPGDIVMLEAEALVPADLRVAEAHSLRVNEAALTGESVPVSKRTKPDERETPLAERASMLFKGTTVVEGRASGIAVATGMQTQLGRVSKMASEAQSTATPLQKKLDQLGRRLAVIVIVVAAGLAGLGYFVRQEDVLLIVETSIALGVAAIPEGLPIVATIALAWGMYAMAKRHALINHLPAVETLGATRIIFTDKTGTLTLNRMTIRRMVTTARDDELHIDSMKRGDELPDYPLLRHAIEIGVLCNNASLASDGGSDGKETDEKPRGDPMELALLEAGRAYGIDRHSLLDRKHELREVSFDPDEMKMATYHQSGEEILVAVKGAPEKLLEVCTRKAEPSEEAADRETELTAAERDFWGGVADDMAAAGLRVLGIADKTVRNADESPYENLRLIGLVGLVDPPREDVRQVINMTQAAGIRIVMVTGDQPRTAEAIAEAVGIVGDVDDPRAVVMHGSELSDPDELSEDERKQVHRTNIFARVSPEQKLDLIRTYQQSGEIVAMTGDGVNDAPALKKADIGVAMGRRGTDAARQVADMILTDDALASIVHAIERGRVTFVNIRKAAMFMLCTNVAEVIAVAVAFAAAWPVPIRPLQILYLNVLTDVLPAMALAVSPGAPDIMQHPPRDPKESVISTRHWLHVIGWGTIIAVCVLAALLTSLWWMQLPAVEAVTTSFLTLGLSKLWFTFILRRSGSNILSNEITANPWVWAAVALCLGLLIAAVYLPGLSGVLETTGPGARGWMLAIVLSLVPMVLGQVWLIGRPGLTASPGERH